MIIFILFLTLVLGKSCENHYDECFFGKSCENHYDECFFGKSCENHYDECLIYKNSKSSTFDHYLLEKYEEILKRDLCLDVFYLCKRVF